MKLCAQRDIKYKKSTIRSFGGIDKREKASEGYFYDMKNMCGDNIPSLSTRKPRAEIDLGEETIYNLVSLDVLDSEKEIVPNALIAYVPNRLKAFYEKDGEMISDTLLSTTTSLTPGKKQIVASGANLYFFPDNRACNMLNMSSSETLSKYKVVELGAGDEYYNELVIEKCNMDGSLNEDGIYGKLSINSYSVLQGGKGELKGQVQFSSGLKENDTVKIYGLSDEALNGFYNIKSVAGNNKHIVVPISDSLIQNTGELVIERKIPQMDFVVASKNRLWGCRYGINEDGKAVNEIYASSLGDGANWYRFENVSTDSWSTAVNAPGAFTGAVCYNGNPIFFKENSIIKIFGNEPSEFTTVESGFEGVEAGSSESIAFVDDALYYKSPGGIVRYDGTVPTKVDRELDIRGYSNAVAGSIENKYYVVMTDRFMRRNLYVYNTVNGCWYAEDDPGIVSFCKSGEKLYVLCENNDKSEVLCLNPKEHQMSQELEKAFDWNIETGDIFYSDTENKYISRIKIRFDKPATSRFSLEVSYDMGRWLHGSYVSNNMGQICEISMCPRRCQNFRIRLQGRGACKIFALSIERRNS